MISNRRTISGKNRRDLRSVTTVLRISPGYKVDSIGRLKHRVISEREDGPIPKGWHVHHCDYVKENNHIDNLVQIPPCLHELIHRKYHPGATPSKQTILDIILPVHMKKLQERELSKSRKSDDYCRELAREISKQLKMRDSYELNKLKMQIINILDN